MSTYTKARSQTESASAPDGALIALLVCSSVLATLVSISWSGLRFTHVEDFFIPLLGLLFALATLNAYQYVRMPENVRLIAFVKMMFIFLIMSITFMTFQYSLALYKAYPITDVIEDIDRSLGFHYISFITTVNELPYASSIIGFCYKNWMREFIVVFAALSFYRKFDTLNELTVSYILAGMSTLSVSGLLDARSVDAVGAYAIAGLHHPSGVSPIYLEKLEHLRGGLDSVMDFDSIIGLVSFPSFHAGAAVLMATATRNLKWLWLPFLGFNILILVGTITEGGHNFTDVIFGCLFTVAAIAVARALRRSTLKSGLAERTANRCQIWIRPAQAWLLTWRPSAPRDEAVAASAASRSDLEG